MPRITNTPTKKKALKKKRKRGAIERFILGIPKGRVVHKVPGKAAARKAAKRRGSRRS